MNIEFSNYWFWYILTKVSSGFKIDQQSSSNFQGDENESQLIEIIIKLFIGFY